MKNAPGIIPALDIDLKTASNIVSNSSGLPNQISAFKVGSLLVMDHGLLRTCNALRKKTSIPLILDMQKSCTDIPEIVEKQVVKAAEAKVQGFIGAPMGAGSERKQKGTLETFVLTCKKFGVFPILLLEMTHPGANFFLKPNTGQKIAEIACELEVPYVVAPANKLQRLQFYKQIFKRQKSRIEVLSPGIGPQRTGDPTRDAAQAVEAGADHVIVGRAIYSSSDPARMISSIFDKTLKAFEKRN